MKALPIALALLMLAAALPAAALPPTSPASAALEDSLVAARQYQELANRLSQGDTLSAFVGLDAKAPVVSFDDAINEYYAAMGITMPDNFVAPPADVAAALAPVIAAVARSATATNAALAVLDDEDRAFLLAHVEALAAPDASLSSVDASRVQALAAQVDTSQIVAGAATLSVAMNALSLPPVAMTWMDPTQTIEVGSTSNDCYYTPRVLIVDLGGNDCYDNEPASYFPGSPLPLPVSIIIDLGGNDQYLTLATHAGGTSAYGQGVGIGGVGLIVDRWGDDTYFAALYDAYTGCPFDFWTGTVQNIFAQGTGLLGVGGITDLSGNDNYIVYNSNAAFNYCHFGFIYTYAQAAGLPGGVGILADGEGDDSYYADTYAYGKADNIASTFAQAVAVNGAAALVDKEGSDRYYGGATGLVTFGYTKGAFAYVFAQASVTTTHRLPQITAASTVTESVFVTPGGLDACRTAGGSPGENQAGSCDAAGVAVLVDVLGDDTFDIAPYMGDGGAGCYNGGWSLGSGQGSAAWSGAAVLVNVDVEGSDSFSIRPTTIAGGCSSPGARAMAHGQGYGGPIVWDFWDAPNRLPVGPNPAGIGTGMVGVGVLASVGVLEPQCVDHVQKVTAIRTACTRLAGLGVNMPQLTASPDSYQLKPYVDSTGGYSFGVDGTATAMGQGAAANSVSSPNGAYGGFGVGLNIDTGGDDRYDATSTAIGKQPYAFVLAQGAAQSSIGGLVNIGGNDAYDGWAYQNGVSVPKNTLVQGYADGIPLASTPTACLAQVISIPTNCVHADVASALAIFVDVIGHEWYSEAAERPGCMGTEPPIGTGTLPFGFVGDEWWGHVIGTPCPTPTPDTGTGTVIGLDWLSTVSA